MDNRTRVNHNLNMSRGLPRHVATMVDWPRPVELGAESLSVCVDVSYALVPSVILAGFNNEDSHRGIFCEASCDSDAREATADDYIVKRLISSIPWIPRYAVGALCEWVGGTRILCGQDKRVCGDESGEDDEAGIHRDNDKERRKERMGWRKSVVSFNDGRLMKVVMGRMDDETVRMEQNTGACGTVINATLYVCIRSFGIYSHRQSVRYQSIWAPIRPRATGKCAPFMISNTTTLPNEPVELTLDLGGPAATNAGQ